MKQKKYNGKKPPVSQVAEPTATYGISDNHKGTVQYPLSNEIRESRMTVDEYIALVRTALDKRYESL
jgi:hypothetical protein